MKIIMVESKGKETLVCESVDMFHGNIMVKLLNQNFSTKVREVKYKLKEMDYVMNKGYVVEGQIGMDELLEGEK